jgi:hypothetical protein
MRDLNFPKRIFRRSAAAGWHREPVRPVARWYDWPVRKAYDLGFFLLTGCFIVIGRVIVGLLTLRRSGDPTGVGPVGTVCPCLEDPQCSPVAVPVPGSPPGCDASSCVYGDGLDDGLRTILGSWNHINAETVDGFLEERLEWMKVCRLDAEEQELSREEQYDQAARLRPVPGRQGSGQGGMHEQP